MHEQNKTPRAAAKLPRGLIDRLPEELAATEQMLRAIKETYELYGFEAVETPFIEFTDALGKFLPDQDRPNEGVFSFKDDDEQWLSLRYDLTAPLARYVAENYEKLPKPYRSYRAGYVFRNEKPGPGRFRQFMQFDADTVGSASVAADAEICMMAADTLERLGIKRGDYVIKVNNRKVLDGMLASIGLGGSENADRRLVVLRAIDKLDRLGLGEVARLLGPGRLDESGDITSGANLSDDQISTVLSLIEGRETEVTFETRNRIKDRPLVMVESRTLSLDPADQFLLLEYDNIDRIKYLRQVLPGNALFQQGFDELEEMASLFWSSGYQKERISIDPSVVRGLEYYTGPVFEAELTFEVQGEDGRPIRFGSVGGGGRYDGLVGRFRGEDVPATGFSIGVSRLYAALKAVGSPIVAGTARRGPVVVLVLDRPELPRYQKFVSDLRQAGIAAELYLGGAGMNAQLKYADKRNAVCAVIQGSNERVKGEVALRDLVLGAKLAASTKDRADYLELRAKAQFAVPEGELVGAVRQILARHQQGE
jgi:histidyl-tRNA synthetase